MRADQSTTKTFYAANIFFGILNQFGPLQPDLEQKQKYAAWKAADISKALKEGRRPVPGPPGGDNDLLSPSSNGYDPEPSRSDLATGHEFDPSTQVRDKFDPPQSSNIPLVPLSDISPSPPSDIPPSPPSNIPPSPPSTIPPSPYPTNDYSSHDFHQSHLTGDYPSHNFHQPPPTNRSEISTYSQPYQQQPFPQEPQQHLPHYQSHETPSYSYSNFQTYPSFTESSLPTAPSHYPSYYHQGSDASYSTPPAPDMMKYPSTAQLSSNGRSDAISDSAPISVQSYQYDSNYQPPPEKIAEAHKAARFAVGALAFDDVSIAVDYLKKSLELLTNPSAEKSCCI